MSANQPGRVVVVGSCNLDFIVAVPALPAAGQTVLGSDAVVRPGGKGANQAVAARRLGAATALVGALGTDRFAGTVRAALAREDLDLTGLISVDGATGAALVIVGPGGENIIAVAPGANRHLTPDRVPALPGLIQPGSVLLLQLETPIRTSIAAAELARTQGARVVFNAAPIPDGADAELAELLARTDVLVVNEGEAQALRPDVDGEDRNLAAALRTLGPADAVVTLGGRGAVLADQHDIVAVPAHQVSAVDTTGAGDAFCGAVAAALAGGRPMLEAVRLGCLAGALATTAVGAQSALPTFADIAAFRHSLP